MTPRSAFPKYMQELLPNHCMTVHVENEHSRVYVQFFERDEGIQKLSCLPHPKSSQPCLMFVFGHALQLLARDQNHLDVFPWCEYDYRRV